MQVGLPIGAFVAAVLVLIPLPWHWRAKNIATLSMIAWLFISNIIFAINSVIWAGNVMNVAPVWCDIGMLLIIFNSIGTKMYGASYKDSNRGKYSAPSMLLVYLHPAVTHCVCTPNSIRTYIQIAQNVIRCCDLLASTCNLYGASYVHITYIHACLLNAF